jgi:hypothetical protein
MAIDINIKPIQLWVLNGIDRKGLLADSTEPLVAAGTDLRVVIAYRFPAEPDRAAVCVFPVDGRSAEQVARETGFGVSDASWLLVQGEERRGMSARIARELADAGISPAFFGFEAMRRKFSALIGVDSNEDARTVTRTIEALARNFRR